MSNVVIGTVESGVNIQKTGKIVLLLLLMAVTFFIKEPGLTKSFFYNLFREASKVQMLWVTRNWQELEGPHFKVRYQGADDANAQMVLDIAEKNYDSVTNRYNYTPKSKTLIAIYPTKESLGKSFGWAADESAMGVYWAGAIRLLSPSAWIEAQNPEDYRDIFENEGPVVHEYTHLLVDYIARGNYTRWFTEGIAQFEEERTTGYSMEHDPVKDPQAFYPLAEMDKNYDNLPDQSLAYYESLEAVNYIVDQYGEEKLNLILLELGKGASMDKAFKTVIGLDMNQFEQAFKLWAVAENNEN